MVVQQRTSASYLWTSKNLRPIIGLPLLESHLENLPAKHRGPWFNLIASQCAFGDLLRRGFRLVVARSHFSIDQALHRRRLHECLGSSTEGDCHDLRPRG